jgi:NAD(P)-dependent dehydrogenase (short-subunit alcohol dehydrogenase family)
MQMKPQSDQRLAGRVAVVTGVAHERGIGRAISLRYAEEGARLALLDLDGEGAGRVADEIVAAGGAAAGIACDITDLAACEAAAARVGEAWDGRVDILVNNAAVVDLVWQPFDEWTVDEWDQLLSVNLRGMWFCARAFVPLMKARGYGKIINVTSSTFWEGVGGFIHYTSSKGGVVGFTRALGRELGEFGIRVNALAPGYTMSDAQSRHVAAHPEHAVAIRARRAIRRDELPEDLAGPAFFLASEDSDFMTCQSLLVEGGGSMW